MPKYTEADPLHLSVELGQIDRVQELLHKGIKVDSRDRHQITPLMVAARIGADGIANVLIKAGANVNAKDRASAIGEGRLTALHHACNIGRSRMVKLLLENGADPDAVSQSLHVPLAIVLGAKRKDLAMLLLQHGANANGSDKCCDPPLVIAAGENDLEMVNELLKRGADPNRIGKSGNVALADTTSVECVRQLLQHGAKVDLKNAEGETPLLANLIRGSFELLKCYVEAGADVNATDKDNATVLMRLTDNPRIEVAEFLIAAGADVNWLPWKNYSLLDFLYSSTSANHIQKRVDLITFLESNGAKRAKEMKAKK